MTPTTAFILSEVLPGDQVTGRCGEATVTLGTVFTGLYRKTFPDSWWADENTTDPELVFVCDLLLQVTRIEMYRRPMEFVSRGCTALLALSGEGLNTAAQLLAAAPARTSYSLCTDHPFTRTT